MSLQQMSSEGLGHSRAPLNPRENAERARIVATPPVYRCGTFTSVALVADLPSRNAPMPTATGDADVRALFAGHVATPANQNAPAEVWARTTGQRVALHFQAQLGDLVASSHGDTRRVLSALTQRQFMRLRFAEFGQTTSGLLTCLTVDRLPRPREISLVPRFDDRAVFGEIAFATHGPLGRFFESDSSAHERFKSRIEVTDGVRALAEQAGATEDVYVIGELCLRLVPEARRVLVTVTHDPEDGTTGLHFRVRTSAPIETVVAAEDRLHEALFERVPSVRRSLFSIGYEFIR